jgi:peptide/nickel transport system permease protein
MSGFRQYLVKRLILALVVVIGMSMITFFLARVAPSDPAALWVGLHARPEQVEKARIELGLDKPLYIQYFIYIRDLVSGSWGISYRTRRPVIEDIMNYLPASIELAVAGLLIASVVGIPLGVVAASKKDTKVDHVCRTFGVLTLSTPSFWMGLTLQLIFARILGILPLQGRLSPDIAEMNPIQRITGFYLVDSLLTGNFVAFQDALLHIILPSITLAAYSTGLSLRMTRSTMIEVLRERYIVAAKAFGMPKNVIMFYYALKNAIIPTLTVLGISFAWTLTGVFLVEVVFNWPGLGTYTWRAILAVDYPVIVAVTVISTLIIVVTNLILDLIQAYLDPRVKL